MTKAAEYWFKRTTETLRKYYQIENLTEEEYEALCYACRKFNVKQIKSQSPIDGTDSSRWIMIVEFRDVLVYLSYITPEGLIDKAHPKEWYERSFGDELQVQ